MNRWICNYKELFPFLNLTYVLQGFKIIQLHIEIHNYPEMPPLLWTHIDIKACYTLLIVIYIYKMKDATFPTEQYLQAPV